MSAAASALVEGRDWTYWLAEWDDGKPSGNKHLAERAERARERAKEYGKRDEVKERRNAQSRVYRQTAQYKEWRKAQRKRVGQTPEHKAWVSAYRKRKRAERRAQKEGSRAHADSE